MPNQGAQAQIREICVFCGIEPATTRDHVPPKAIFPKPRPNDLITVPACGTCNTGVSKREEKFRVLLSLQVGMDSPQTEKLWKKHALDTLRKQPKLRSEILKSMEDVWVKTPGVVIAGKRTMIKWDNECHDQTIIKITKGLYFHHFGEILESGENIRPYFFYNLTPEMVNAFQEFPANSIGRNQFVYKFGRLDEKAEISVWLYQFFERHFSAAVTSPNTLDALA